MMQAVLCGDAKRLVVLGVLLTALMDARIAQAIAPRQLLEVTDIANVVMSPDASRVAFRVERVAIERNVIDSAWYVQEIDGSSPAVRVAEGGFVVHAYYGLPSPEPALWSPDGRWIYYRAMIDGKMDVWRAAADGSGAVPVTLDPADVREFHFSGDGRTLYYSIGASRAQEAAAEQRDYHQGVLVNKTVPIGQPLFRSGYLDGRLSTQRYRGGRELVRDSILADVESRWKAIDLATGERQEAIDRVAIDRPDLATALSSEGGEPFARATDAGGGRVAILTRVGEGAGLYRKPYAQLSVLLEGARSAAACQADACRSKAITSIQWRPASDEVLFTVTDPDEGLAQSIFRWNVATGAVAPVLRSRGLINGGRDERHLCGMSAQVLVCVAVEADRPPRLERIDIDTGQRHTLFDPNAALAWRIAQATPARLLRWKDAHGHPFTGQFFAAAPEGSRPPPLFVNYYQCSGFVRGGTGDEWPLASMAASGISALCINNAPPRLDAVERYDQGLSAVGSAIDLLAAAGEIDRERVGMGGLSLGTEVTLWTVMHSNLLAAASISSAFPSPLAYELRSLYEDTFYPGLRQYWQLGSPQETPERWRRLSPVFNLQKVRVPILMQLPEQEYLLSLDWSIPLVKGRLAELHVFADEAHFKFQPKHKLAVYERNLDWFRFWLQGYEDPAPSKAEQYRHWRTMRDAK